MEFLVPTLNTPTDRQHQCHIIIQFHSVNLLNFTPLCLLQHAWWYCFPNVLAREQRETKRKQVEVKIANQAHNESLRTALWTSRSAIFDLINICLSGQLLTSRKEFGIGKLQQHCSSQVYYSPSRRIIFQIPKPVDNNQQQSSIFCPVFIHFHTSHGPVSEHCKMTLKWTADCLLSPPSAPVRKVMCRLNCSDNTNCFGCPFIHHV